MNSENTYVYAMFGFGLRRLEISRAGIALGVGARSGGETSFVTS